MVDEYATISRFPLPSGVAGIELLRARFVDQRFAPHSHEDYAIGVVERGGLRTRTDQGTVEVRAGQLIILHPGEVHTGEAIDHASGYCYRMLYLPAALLQDVRAAIGTARPSRPCDIVFSCPVVSNACIARQLLAAINEIERAVDELAEGALRRVLSALIGRHASVELPTSTEPTDTLLVRRVRQYLEDEHVRVVSLGELAALTGRSASSVSRIFRAAVGIPPYAYLALVRVRRARDMLARGYPPALVANETGFTDQSHLTKQFKRVVGLPPGQYLRGLTPAGKVGGHMSGVTHWRQGAFGSPRGLSSFGR